MIKSILTFSLLSCVFSVHALNVGDITTFMYSNQSNVHKEIKNATDEGRLITIKVERITSPQEGGEVIPMESKDELLLTPTHILLPAQSSEVIRFFYNGPKDNIERYYRIVWHNQSLADNNPNQSSRKAVASTSALIGTILVVAPRQERFEHTLTNNVVVNKGNSTIRIIAYGPCIKKGAKPDCKEHYYLMPNQSATIKQINLTHKKGHIAAWQGDNFVAIK